MIEDERPTREVDPRPVVSVIVNVWNGEPTVEEAIESVLAQTFQNWEMIVWDDGSTDASRLILERFNDPRIRLFSTPVNFGLGRARDAAIRHARGEWIAFLDQDDVWMPRKLELQVSLGGDPEVGLVYGRTLLFNARNKHREYDHRHEYEPLPEGDIFEDLFVDSCFIAMSAAMLRRSAIDAIGGIPPEITVIPDYFLFLEVASRFRARAVQEVICRYRDIGSGMSHYSRAQMHREALLLVDRWSGRLSPGVRLRRLRIHSTVLAFEEMLSVSTFPAGFRRLVTRGSVPFLLSRPFARAFRAIRRNVATPFYKREGTGASPVGRRLATTGAAEASRPAPLLLTVIVVNWKVAELLREALRSLEAEMLLPESDWELIVVDNASADGSVEMLKREFPKARLIANQENIGFGRANNQAFEISRGEYVLLLNPDTVVLNHAVDGMLRWMECRPEAGALGCRLLNSDGSFQRWTGGHRPTRGNVLGHFLLLYKLLPVWMLPPPLYLETDPVGDLEVGWVSGACMLLRREALAGALFDERFFMYGEDLDLCDRLRGQGWKIFYTPAVEIVHHGGRSLARQSSEVHLSKLSGMRRVFASRHGRASMVFYDLVVAAGFVARFVINQVLHAVRPGAGFGAQAEMSRRFCAEAFRTLFRTGRNAHRSMLW